MKTAVKSSASASSWRQAGYSSFQRFSFQHFSSTQIPLFPPQPPFPRPPVWPQALSTAFSRIPKQILQHKNTINTIKQLLTTAALVGFTAIPASAATTLYSDDFSSPWEGASNNGTDPLNGTTPNIAIGTNTWTADQWRENGTAPTVNSSTADHSAFLAFAPTGGTIYTLSATLTQPTGGQASGWAAIGFTGGNTTTGSFFLNDAAPWMLWRPSDATIANQVVTFLGPGTSTTTPTNAAGVGSYTGTATFDIVLNTEAAAWTAEWFVNGSWVRTETYGTNPTITHIGLGRENGQSSTFSNFSLISNFSLTVIPEPSSALAGLLLAAGLLRRRRNVGC